MKEQQAQAKRSHQRKEEEATAELKEFDTVESVDVVMELALAWLHLPRRVVVCFAF